MAMIPRAETTIHAENFQSSNNNYSCAGPAEVILSDWERSSATALGSIVNMTSYWNAYKLDIPMQWPMAKAMMSVERKPSSSLPSRDGTHTMIVDFTEITVSNSDDVLHLVRVMSAT